MLHITEIEKKALSLTISEAQLYGGHMDRSRFRDVLNYWLPRRRGNIVEIGGGNGDATIVLCEMAKKYRRKLIVIDPFESGWANMPESYGKPYPENVWRGNVGEYPILIRKESKKAVKDLRYHAPISFAFIDGLQTKEAVLSDLKMMDEYGCLICVDDVNRLTEISQVPLALKEFHRQLIPTTKNEGYLI